MGYQSTNSAIPWVVKTAGDGHSILKRGRRLASQQQSARTSGRRKSPSQSSDNETMIIRSLEENEKESEAEDLYGFLSV